MGHEEISKAYPVFGIEAGQSVITRDVNFDESAFGFSPTLLREAVEDAALDFGSRTIDDEPRKWNLSWLEKNERIDQDTKKRPLEAQVPSVVEMDLKRQVY